MQDHIAPGGLFWTVKQPVTLSLATIASPTNLPNNLVDYALFGRGYQCLHFFNFNFNLTVNKNPEAKVIWGSQVTREIIYIPHPNYFR